MKDPATKITILVVDDHPIVRMGIVAMLSTSDRVTIAGEASSGEEAIELHGILNPEITLIDLRLPGISGVETIRRIRSRNQGSRFIVLTMYEGDEDIHQAISAGASGYLVKGMRSDTLLHAIQRVQSGGRFIPPPVLRTLQSRTPNAELTAREREVLSLLAQGMSNKQIAAKLHISEITVKCHVSVILMRLDATDRTHAVVIALQRGLVHL
jgi:two-component system, NarL family, response regulator